MKFLRKRILSPAGDILVMDIQDSTQLTSKRYTTLRNYQPFVHYGKPIVVRLSDGELLATGFYSHRDDKDYTYPDGRSAHTGQYWMLEEAVLFRSTDEGKIWSPPRLLRTEKR